MSSEVDPAVLAIVDEVAASYGGLVPPEALAAMRELVIDALAIHPVGAALAERVTPRAVPDRSGEQAEPGPVIEGMPTKKVGEGV